MTDYEIIVAVLTDTFADGWTAHVNHRFFQAQREVVVAQRAAQLIERLGLDIVDGQLDERNKIRSCYA